MPFAELGELKLHYERAGAGDRELLFVPGWCCDTSAFEPQFEHFAATCRVTAVDLRGCGRSSQPDDGYDIPSLADDVARLCRALGIERPIVIGHSLGGMIGVELAARWPSLTRAVIGVDPGPIDYLPATRLGFAAFADALDGPDGEAVRRNYVAEIPGATMRGELAGRIVETMCAVPLEIARAVIRGVAEWNGEGALWLCSGVPILVIRAHASSTDEIGRLRRLKPDLQIGITVGAGHFNQLEVPDQVNAMIERFLDSLP
jgi:pimeloyl-ACP methyl ester carboxylesterase